MFNRTVLLPFSFFFSGMLLLFSNSHAQNATQTPAPAVPVIEYKWTTGQLSDIMPFDRPFSIKITGIAPSIERLGITIYEIRRNYQLFPKQKGKKRPINITYEQFQQMPWMRSYTLEQWNRPPGNSDTFAFIAQPYHLRPNSQYVIEIGDTTTQDLTDQQKEDLKNKLNQSQPIRDMFTNLARHQGLERQSLENAIPIQGELNNIIQVEVKKVNLNYVFKAPAPADEDAQLGDLVDYLNAVAILAARTRKLATDKNTGAPFDANKATAQNLLRAINSADFGKFAFEGAGPSNLEDQVKKLQKTNKPEFATYDAKIDELTELNQTIADQAQSAVAAVLDEVVLNNTYDLLALASDFPVAMTDQSSNYLAMDFGLAYVGNFSRIQSYYGLNIYLRPVNKDIPSDRYITFGDFMLTRTSLLLGITFGSVEKDNVRKGVLGDKGFLLGAGFKIVSFLRVQGGGLLYYRFPTDPLANKENYSLRVSPFVSLSLDLSLKDVLGVFGTAFFPASNTTH